MSRNQAYRLAGDVELQALQPRIYRSRDVKPSEQAAYGRRGEMVDMRPLERDVLSWRLGALKWPPKE